MKIAAVPLILSIWCSVAVAQEAPVSDPAAPEYGALLKSAEADLAAGRTEAGVVGLRRALVLAPDNHDTRLRLAGVLMDQGRHAEAMPEIQRVLAARPDVAAHTAWLRVLEAVGSPLGRALAAEEAARRHPGHLPFAFAAAEALVPVGAHEQALGYWRKLPKSEQASPKGQYLLGAIHEAAGRLLEAMTAYRAAKGEPRAQDALTRLRERALDLGGLLYIPPAGWTLLPGEPRRLIELRAGTLATPTWQPRAKPQEALRKALVGRLPLPAEFPFEQALSGKRQTPPKGAPPDPLRVEPIVCAGRRPMRCVEAGPSQEFAGLLPQLQAGAADLKTGTLVVVLEGAQRDQAGGLLRTLLDAPVDTGQP